MKHILIILSILALSAFWACNNPESQQKEETPKASPGKQEIQNERKRLDSLFADTLQSPLKLEDLKDFDSLNYFPPNENYKVQAKFVRTPNSQAFGMPTNTERRPVYEKYGEAHFQLKGENLVLNIYQNHELREKPEYKDYLFLPFADATNGHESYSGGRYMDMSIPEGDSVIIDFNKAYNPYCAYNEKYSCPLIPKENTLDIRIEAGVKKYKYH
jgi:uncharacterized protein